MGSWVITDKDPANGNRLVVECWREPVAGADVLEGPVYNIRYQLQSAPQARDDGSSAVDHEVVVIYQVADDWRSVPYRKRVIPIDAFKLANVLAMPHSTPEEREAKIDNYKLLLYQSRDWDPPSQDAWDINTIQSMLDANDTAMRAASEADEFLTVTLGTNYPIGFDLKGILE